MGSGDRLGACKQRRKAKQHQLVVFFSIPATVACFSQSHFSWLGMVTFLIGSLPNRIGQPIHEDDFRLPSPPVPRTQLPLFFSFHAENFCHLLQNCLATLQSRSASRRTTAIDLLGNYV